MWHAHGFCKSNGGDSHFEYQVPGKNILEYNDTGVVKDMKVMTWNRFMSMATKGEIEKSTYEQVLFKSNCRKVMIVPLPVLSTPSILLALDYEVIKNNQYEILRLIYTRSRDTVSKFLYTRLIESLTAFLDKNAESITEMQLVEAFVNELCKVLIPYSYRISNGVEVPYYTDWPMDGFSPSLYELPLLDNKYNVVFRLTSFAYCDFENPHSGKMPFIHESEMFRATLSQSSRLICRLFKLFHKNWELSKSAEERAYAKIAEMLSHIKMDVFDKAVDQFKKEINDTKAIVQNSTGFLPPNQLIVNGDNVTLRVNNQLLVTSDLCKGNNNQIDGFRCLAYLLKKYSGNSDTNPISAEELYDNAGVTNSVINKTASRAPKYSQDVVRSARLDLSDCADTILGIIINAVDVLTPVIKNGKFGKNESLIEAFFSAWVLMNFYNERSLKNYHNHKDFLQTDSDSLKSKFEYLDKLCNIYKAEYPLLFDSRVKAAKNICKEYINRTYKSLKIWGEKNATSNKAGILRACMKAMVGKLQTLLASAINEQNLEKERAFNHLLANLVEAGLIQKDKQEPVHQNQYSYHQQNGGTKFIEWHL